MERKKYQNRKIVTFTDLEAWKQSHALVLMVYAVSKSFPKEEVFSLTSQIRRAAISITSNIAEGFGRESYKERVYFYLIARGSLNELTNQVFLARDLDYIKKGDFDALDAQIEISRKLLFGLVSKSKQFIS